VHQGSAILRGKPGSVKNLRFKKRNRVNPKRALVSKVTRGGVGAGKNRVCFFEMGFCQGKETGVTKTKRGNRGRHAVFLLLKKRCRTCGYD